MERLGQRLVMGAGVAALIAIFAVMAPERQVTAGPGSAPVTVANTAANPVPVTGSVQAEQSGSWNVGVSGAVAITGTPGVTIANPVLVVRHEPARFQRFFTCQFDGIIPTQCSAQVNIGHPAGQRAVIEFISAQIRVQPGQKATFDLSCGGPAFVPAVPQGTYTTFSILSGYQTRDYFNVSERVVQYCSSDAIVRGLRDSGSGEAELTGSLSGYFEPEPAL